MWNSNFTLLIFCCSHVNWLGRKSLPNFSILASHVYDLSTWKLTVPHASLKSSYFAGLFWWRRLKLVYSDIIVNQNQLDEEKLDKTRIIITFKRGFSISEKRNFYLTFGSTLETILEGIDFLEYSSFPKNNSKFVNLSGVLDWIMTLTAISTNQYQMWTTFHPLYQTAKTKKKLYSNLFCWYQPGSY